MISLKYVLFWVRDKPHKCNSWVNILGLVKIHQFSNTTLQFYIAPAMCRCSICCTSLPILVLTFNFNYSSRTEVVCRCILYVISLMTKHVEQIFMFLFPIEMYYLWNIFLKFSSKFLDFKKLFVGVLYAYYFVIYMYFKYFCHLFLKNFSYDDFWWEIYDLVFMQVVQQHLMKKEFLFSVSFQLLWNLCQKSIYFIGVGSFRDLMFCSTDLFTLIPVLHYLEYYSYNWILK